MLENIDKNSKPRGPRKSVATPIQTLPDDALVDIKVTSDMVGLKSTAIYDKIKKGIFPVPERLGTRCTRFRLGKLRRWLADPWGYIETN